MWECNQKGLIQLRITGGAAIEMESSFNPVGRIVHKQPESALILYTVGSTVEAKSKLSPSINVSDLHV